MYKIIKENYRVLVFQLSCALIAISLGAAIGTSLEFAHYRHRFFKNISVGHVLVSNTSETDALKIVEEHYNNDFKNVKLSLKLNNKVLEAPTAQFIKSSNIKDIVTDAFNYSESLSLIDRYRYLTNRLQKNFELTYTYDDKAIKNFVDDFIKRYSHVAENATIQISTDGEISHTAEINGLQFNKDALYKAVYEALSPTQTTALEAQNNIITIDATPFSTVQIPTVTNKSLTTIDTLVTSVFTSYTSGTGSDVNIGVASRTINGTLVMPNETFSYNDIIGNTTIDKGYTYAPVIINSQMAQGVGGGVCQVSSTLYNAVLNVGILPIERRPHSRPSSYLPLGLDAAIDWETTDFKFINTLPYPIYITSYTAGNKIYVDIYSNESLTSTTYKFRSEVQKILESTTKYITDSSLPSGSKQLYSTGSNGYTVKVSRDTYFKGTLQNSEVLYYDTYAAVPTIYKVN